MHCPRRPRRMGARSSKNGAHLLQRLPGHFGNRVISCWRRPLQTARGWRSSTPNHDNVLIRQHRKGTLHLRAKAIDHEITTSCRTKPHRHWEENISVTFPLLSRAWGFQERLLATRAVHFTPSELVWECQEARWCECGALTTLRRIICLLRSRNVC